MLELRNVSFEVNADGDDKEIIKNISLKIPDEKLVVVTGPNGGGKSTLARLIAGIERPTSGSLFFEGKDITDMSVTDRANMGIGFALAVANKDADKIVEMFNKNASQYSKPGIPDMKAYKIGRVAKAAGPVESQKDALLFED